MKKQALLTMLALAVLGGAAALWFARSEKLPETAAEWLALARETEKRGNAEISASRLTGGLPPGRLAALEKEIADAYWKVVEEHPGSPEAPEAHWSVMQRSREQGKLTERGLVEALDDFAEKYPDSGRAAALGFEVAELLRGMGESEEAIERYLAFVEARPGHEQAPGALYQVLLLLKNLERYEEAEALATRIIEKYPDSPAAIDAQYERATLRVDFLDRVKEALIDFREVAKQAPDSSRGRVAEARRREIGTKEIEKKQDETQEKYYGAKEIASYTTHVDADEAEIFAMRAQAVEIVDYKVRVRLAIRQQRLYAAARFAVEVHADAEEPIAEKLAFRLNQYLVLERIELDGQKADYERKGDLTYVTLPEPLELGSRHEFFFEHWGEAGENAVIHERGAHLKIGSNWHPGFAWHKPHPVETVVVVPEGWTGVGPGLPAGKEEVAPEGSWGPSVAWKWQQEAPIISVPVVAGRYATLEEELRPGVLLQCFAYEEDKEALQPYIDGMRRVVDFYEEILAPYPHQRLAAAEVPFFPGGHGPPTLLMIGDSVFTKGARALDKLLAHEIAHQWFGTLVVSTYEGESAPWLSEGFATFMDALYIERESGRQAYIDRARDMGTIYFEALYAFDDLAVMAVPGDHPLYHPLTYEKGALVLHMLRGAMGDGRFFACLREYVARYSHKVATIDDFRAVAEEFHGESLEWFFYQWLRESGYPRYKLARAQASQAHGSWMVELDLEQVGEMLFEGPVEARIFGREEGQEVSVRFSFGFRDSKAGLCAAVPFEPQSVEVDPDAWVLKYPALDELTAEF